MELRPATSMRWLIRMALGVVVAVVVAVGGPPSPALAEDTDGDGCTDAEELGPDPLVGGQRDPNNFWDFYDVPAPPIYLAGVGAAKDGFITVGIGPFWGDGLAVAFYLGTVDNGPPNANGADYDDDLNLNGVEDGAEYDRTPSADPTKPWQSGPPSGAVTVQDAFVLAHQFGSSCSGVGGVPPSPPPPSQPPPLAPANAIAVDADPNTAFPLVESEVLALVGGAFSVDIDITGAASPYFAYQYTATWDGAILSLLGATPVEPPDLPNCRDPSQTAGVAAPNVRSTCWAGTGTTTTFTGATDTLAFECIAPGTSAIHLVTGAEEPLNFRTATMASAGHFIETNLSDVTVTCLACTPPFTPIAPGDSDCDAAPDADEVGTNPATCGTRDQNDPWDFYDVPVPTIHSGGDMDNRDSAVTLFNDVLGVLEYSGALEGMGPNGAGRNYDDDVDGDTVKDGIVYDREVGAPWPELGPTKFHTAAPNPSPNGAVTLFVDVVLVLDQTGHICPP